MYNGGVKMKCGQKTEVYSRIVGYFRPVNNWNAGKKQEFTERKTFVENKALEKELKTKPIQQELLVKVK